MFNADVFKNLDNEFRETLINFVCEQMAEKNKYENSEEINCLTFINEKYGENDNKDNINEKNISKEY